MPRGTVASARACMTRRRERARANGFCSTCCKQRPVPGRSVCVACTVAALERKKRKRIRDREAAQWRHVITAQEQAGDKAREHHLYEDAAHYYHNALAMRAMTPVEHARISEKLAYALSLGRNPRAASPVFDRLLGLYRGDAANAKKVVEVLFQGARQSFIDEKMEAALPLLAQAIEVADKSDDGNLQKIATIRMANYLIALSRSKEAEHFLGRAENVSDADELPIQAEYFTQKAILAAQLGQAEAAYELFERVVRMAESYEDVYQLAAAWMIYGAHAFDFGDMALARNCSERALLIARRYHIIWLIPRLCLRYAHLLFCAGQYGVAMEYLLDALAYDADTPMLATTFAETGIPIALKMHDDSALSRCVRLSVVDHILQSGSPYTIGTTAAAFAQWHIANGRASEAQALLHRAVEVIPSSVHAYWVIDFEFPLSIARYGLLTDVPHVRNLIIERTKLPHSEVAQAGLHLFDAFVAHRKKSNETLPHATKAHQLFANHGWHHYATLAQTLITRNEESAEIVSVKPFATMLSVLTGREQQVAELVLKGYGNRAIAEALSIKERTVESHMTSIMHHLGVHSRHQLMALSWDSTMRV